MRLLHNAADGLRLAAAPAFAAMALLAGGTPDALCLAAPGAAPLDGMAAMYLLMALFHAGPWLRLAGGLRWPAYYRK